jgi:hypothetical protein
MPVLRLGSRAYMRSTYDRAGGNEGADASHFLRSEADDFNVVLDAAGPGILYFARANHWHGSPWHCRVDGQDHVVTESATADPTAPPSNPVWMPEATFAPPLALTWPVTHGSDVSFVPIPFERSLQIGYGRTHYGTGYFIYDLYPEGASNLSRPIRSFAGEPADPSVLDLLSRAGEDIAPAGVDAELVSGTVDVGAGGSSELATLIGARSLRALTLRIPREQAQAAASARLRIRWDAHTTPAVDAPLALFFGAGTFYNRDDREWLVRSLLLHVRYTSSAIELACYFPMPFASHSRIELQAGDADLNGVAFELRSVALPAEHEPMGYFHATYRDHPAPTPGQDLVILDTQTAEDGGQHCGSFNGMSFVFSHAANPATLEGDPRFFFDDSLSPQAQGTGTEEWAGGGDYFEGQTTTLPLFGHPAGAALAALAQSDDDQIESAYRLLIADAMPFGRNARIQLEHGAVDDSVEHYESVAYWYGTDAACLEPTDALDVGSSDDERAHAYASPTASPVETVTSRYELGPDHAGSMETFPEVTEDGRHMTGTTEFRVLLRPDNFGVLLRRRLDYAFPDQRAEVFVAEDRNDASFERAGIWYLAGSNRCLYSNPKGELDAPTFTVESSNRRLREDEFAIRSELTRGRSALKIRIVWSKIEQPLMPGAELGELAWSELRYTAYCWVLPERPP